MASTAVRRLRLWVGCALGTLVVMPTLLGCGSTAAAPEPATLRSADVPHASGDPRPQSLALPEGSRCRGLAVSEHAVEAAAKPTSGTRQWPGQSVVIDVGHDVVDSSVWRSNRGVDPAVLVAGVRRAIRACGRGVTSLFPPSADFAGFRTAVGGHTVTRLYVQVQNMVVAVGVTHVGAGKPSANPRQLIVTAMDRANRYAPAH